MLQRPANRSPALLKIALRLALLLQLAGMPASADPQHGGTLIFVLSAEPTALVAFSTDAVMQISPKATEGLLTYDLDLNPAPQLATAWSISADGKEYTFKLREGVKWHDGADFTSEDVAFSIRLLKEIHPRGRATFANVVDVRTPNRLTAILILDRPAPYLIHAFAAEESPIVPKHIYAGAKADANPHNAAPIGTGPFRFKEWARGSHIIFERNPDYWDKPKPYVDRIVFKVVPDQAARTLLFETGEADVARGEIIPLSEIDRIKALPFIAIETRGSIFRAGVKRLEFNLENPYFANLKVRQAVAHAIDKNFIRDVVWFGHGQIVSGPISPDLKPFFVTDIPHYPFDPKKAEQLLDEAGYPRGAGGVRFKLVHDFRPSTDGDRRTADYVKQALARIGVDVTVRAQDFASYVKRVYTDRDFAFTTNSMTNTFDPTIGVQRLYWSKNFKRGVPFSNGSGYKNEEVDRLLEAAAEELDPEKRVDEFARVQRIVATELPDLTHWSISKATY